MGEPNWILARRNLALWGTLQLTFSCIERLKDAAYYEFMAMEIARLCLGLLIAGFHVPIADFVLKQEDSIILACRKRGVDLRTSIPRKVAQNFYFTFGILITLVQLVRLHQMVF